MTWRAALCVVVGAVTVVLGVQAARMGVEYDNASLTARDADADRIYAQFKATFGNDEDLLLAVTAPFLLEVRGLRLLDEVTREVEGWAGVRRVWSLTTVDELVTGPSGPTPRRLLLPPWDAAAAGVAAALARNPDLVGWLVSADRRTAGIVVELEDRPGDARYRAAIIARARRLVHDRTAGDLAVHLTGIPVQKYDVSSAVDRDQRVLLPLAIVVLAVALGLFFRRPAGVLLPLGVAGLTVVWTVGVYGWTGHDVNAITSLLPPVLLVIALAASVHVYEVWRAGDAGGDTGATRAARAARAIAAPAALCAATTAQGFGSLVMSEIPAVRQLGLFVALGTGIAFGLGLGLQPLVLARLVPPGADARGRHRWTPRLLDATAMLATTRPRMVLAVFAAVTVLAAAGIPRVRANTDLVGFLRGGAELPRDTAFVDRHLTGTLPLDFVIRRRDAAPMVRLDDLERLAALEDAVRGRPGVTTVTSILAIVRQVQRAVAGGAMLALPADDDGVAAALDLLAESGHPLVGRFAAPDMTSLRLAIRVRAMGTAESAPLIESIREAGRQVLGASYELQPTGSLYRVIRDSTRLVHQQVMSFATAIALVVLAIGLVFRSFVFTGLALIPNVLPIVWTAGLMGFAGIDLSTGTVMIASAVLGLVVDDTIYFLWHYRRVHRGDTAAAIRETTHAVGAPVTAASVSLVLGFWVGALGSFTPTIYFSVLTGLTMITGVVCDLLLLPASLMVLARWSRV